MASIGKEIRKLMIDKEINTTQLSEILGINRATLYKKLNDELEFTRKEIEVIIKKFNLSNEKTIAIFFTHKVS